jgi:cytochrome P450
MTAPVPDPPRPEPPPLYPGLPLLGNAHRLFSDPAALLVDAYRRLGGVFRLRALWKSFTVIAGSEAQAFMADGLDDQHLTRHPLFDPLQSEFGRADFVMAHSGERHTRLRAALAVTFSRQVASPHVAQLTEVVRDRARAYQTGTGAVVTDLAGRLAFAQWCRLLGPSGKNWPTKTASGSLPTG